MSEEIERLIFDLEGCCGMFDYMLTPLENSLLVSYIKDLQQENQQLKENYKLIDKSMSELIEENQQLKQKYENAVADYESEKSKNQRAIEYINREDICIDIRDNNLNYISTNELLEILKGDNNE